MDKYNVYIIYFTYIYYIGICKSTDSIKDILQHHQTRLEKKKKDNDFDNKLRDKNKKLKYNETHIKILICDKLKTEALFYELYYTLKYIFENKVENVFGGPFCYHKYGWYNSNYIS